MTARLRLPVLIGAVALLALACTSPDETRPAFSGDISKGNPQAEAADEDPVSGAAPEPTPLSAAAASQLASAVAASPEGCEVLDARSCLLPFPSDAYTVEDDSTATGVRVALPDGILPNGDGAPLDVTEWNRNDGFSPSTPIVAHVPGLDAEATGIPGEGDIEASTSTGSPTVIVDLDTGRLVPHWAELDQRATSDADSSLILRPAVSLTETHRFAVALRDLKDESGETLPAPIAFRVLRDNNPTDQPRIEERRAELEPLFEQLADAGVNRADVFLAWTFTVASPESLAGRALAMRDDAMGKLNGGAPQFEVTGVRTDELRDGIAHVVDGTFEVPLYLQGDGSAGSRMSFDGTTDRPVATGTYTADFICVVPEEAVESGGARPVVYGHGLLGSAGEVDSGHVQETAAKLNAVYCATDEIGMASDDVTFAIEALGNLSRFPAMPDRMQQGLLNALYLGRLLVHDDGFGSADEFRTADGASVLDTESAYYDGNSQGAIMGGAVTALAQDWTKATLGVGGMNYSTLLNRSKDFDQYAVVLRGAYPNPLDQQLIFGVLQMLWDRGETSGYVQHLTDRTYARTPAKQIVMTVAYGDHQVATVTAENIARTLNIPVYQPILPDGVNPLEQPFHDLSPVRNFPHQGSALFFFYSGTLAPPVGNITPEMSEEFLATCSGDAAEDDVRCIDPHEDPRRQPAVHDLKDAFFRPDGAVTNVCHDEPCIAETRGEFDY